MTPRVDHLALLVVYYLKDDDDLPLLQLHLERLERHTKVRHTLFAAVNRATPAARALVEEFPGVRVCSIEPTEARGSREHAYYLDALVGRALEAGASHLCTFDVDSFPIGDDWVPIVQAATPPESGLAGVCRRENGDVALPHPSCVFATRGFYEAYHPSFSPDTDGTAEFRRFLRATGQRADTGVRLGAVLWAARLSWGRLLRSNAVNLHYLMGGIYADAVFHLGGVGRGKLFRRDLDRSTAHRLSAPLERLPLRGPRLAGAKAAVLRRVRGPTEARLARANRASYEALRDRLLADPDGLLGSLRGRSG